MKMFSFNMNEKITIAEFNYFDMLSEYESSVCSALAGCIKYMVMIYLYNRHRDASCDDEFYDLNSGNK